MHLSLKRIALGAASALLIALATNMWAAPGKGAARNFLGPFGWTNRALASKQSGALAERRAEAARRVLPASVRFRQSQERGLLVRAWVNGVGPYNLAIDTGAGATFLSERLAQEAHVSNKSGRLTYIRGMSGTSTVAGREAILRSLAIGAPSNLLPAKGLVIISNSLPPEVDGILDPTEAYWPLGYTIDMLNGEIRAFDPHQTPIRISDAPPGGAVVPWLFDAESKRPYVMLAGGHRALLDTGSGFGLAISESAARSFGVEVERGRERVGSQDLGGGRFMSRRIRPLTVQVGSLTLYRVPTDLLSGVEAGAPVLLGREALQPFELSFDPVNRLIRFTPPRDN